MLDGGPGRFPGQCGAAFDGGASVRGPETGPTTDPGPAWTTGFDSFVAEGLAVDDGTVYGAAGEQAFAVDAATGEVEWTGALRSGFASGGVSVAGDTVFTTTTGGAVALDAADGGVEWTVPLSTAAGTGVVAGGAFVVPTADGTLVALDAASGTEWWRFDAGRDLPATPVAAEGTVFVVGTDPDTSAHRLHAVETADGREAWTFAADGDVGTTALAVDDGTVFASLGGDCHALDAGAGRPRWSTVGHGWTDAAVAADTVVGVTPAGRVAALDRETGRVAWTAACAEGRQAADAGGAVVVDDGTAYVNGVDTCDDAGCPVGVVAGFDADAGRQRFSATVEEAELLPTTPAVADGRLVVGTFDGSFHAFETPGEQVASVV